MFLQEHTKELLQFQWGSDIMDQQTVDTAISVGKWANIVAHIRANRIEYLLLIGICHLIGVTEKAYSQVSGVCI